MIDVHCHILPELDDGADSLQTALMMAAMAADDGVETIFATPHVTWNNGTGAAQLKEIADAAASFQAALRENGIPVGLVPGAEVLCAGADAPLTADDFPRLGGSAYTLVEFFFDEHPTMIDDTLKLLLQAGLKPIVAHPERYDCVQRSREVLDRWRRQGALLQMNQGSPLGLFGRQAKKTAEWMLKNQLADLMASDAHSTGHRSTRMAEPRKALARRYGDAYLRRLTETNPQRILESAHQPFL